jgi:hypothetical protein
MFLDWSLGFEPTLQLNSWNLRGLQSETHMRASILNIVYIQGVGRQWCLGPHVTHETESPMTIALQALSLVEKAEPVQVRFTLRLRDQRSMWMQDGCRVYMDSYMASNGSCPMVTRTIFKNQLLEAGPTQNRGSWHYEPSQPFIYHVRGPAWIEIHRNSTWLRNLSHVTSHYNWGSVTTLHDKIV